jgi:hypothetical protein
MKPLRMLVVLALFGTWAIWALYGHAMQAETGGVATNGPLDFAGKVAMAVMDQFGGAMLYAPVVLGMVLLAMNFILFRKR